MNVFWWVFFAFLSVGIPAMLGFLIGTKLSAENYRWVYFKEQWWKMVVAGLLSPLAFLWITQSDPSWWPLCPASAGVTFLAYAFGSRFNPKYRPNGKNPWGMAIELVVIFTTSAVAGVLWSLLPGGQRSWWIVSTLLVLFVVYMYLFYDSKPKGNLKEDRALLGVCFVIEAVAFVIAAILWAIAVGATFAAVVLLQLTSVDAWLKQEGTIPMILLIFWVVVSLILLWLIREPEGTEYPDHVLPRA